MHDSSGKLADRSSFRLAWGASFFRDMSCCICFEVVEDEPFYAHEGKMHLFHMECVMHWFESDSVFDLNCPYCQQPLYDVSELISHSDNARNLLWNSTDPVHLKMALEISYFNIGEKVGKLNILASKGLTEAFETVWSTLKYDSLGISDYDTIAGAAIRGGQIDLFKYLVETGRVQIYDLCDAFEAAISQDTNEFVELLFYFGFSSFAGPRIYNDEKRHRAGLMLFKAVHYDNLEAFNFLLNNGYNSCITSEREMFGILTRALVMPDRPYLNILLALGLDPCVLRCKSFMTAAECGNLSGVKWFVEEARCTHTESWKRVKEISLEHNYTEMYKYICAQLGDEPTELDAILLENSLIFGVAGSLEKLKSNGMDLTKYFPQFSTRILNVEHLQFLLENDCCINQIHGNLFADLTDQGRSDIIAKLLESGLKIDNKLLNECLETWGSSEARSDFLDIFIEHDCVDLVNPDLWDFVERSGIDLAFRLIKPMDKSTLFKYKTVITMLSETSSLTPVMRYLVEEGLPANAFDGTLVSDAIRNGDLEYLLFLLEKDPSIDLNNHTKMVFAFTRHRELFSHVLEHHIDLTSLSDQDIVSFLRFGNPEAVMLLVSRLETARNTLSSIDIEAQRIVGKDKVDTFVGKYFGNGPNYLQDLLIHAAKHHAHRMISFILKKHPGNVQINGDVLKAALESDSNEVIFSLARLHSLKCSTCAEFTAQLPFNDPKDIVLVMIQRH